MDRTKRFALLASLGYALIALLILAPVLAEFTRAIPGGPVAAIDGWQHVWHLWWAERALTSGQNPFYTTLIYYPTGVSLAVHPLNLSNGVLALPITALLGPIAGFNVALFLAIVLSGLGAYFFALQLCQRPAIAFVAGLIFACSPYHLTKIWDGQLELIALQWLPFYALFLLRTMQQPGWRNALIAGLFLAIIGYTSLYYLLFMALYSAAFVLLWLRPALQRESWQLLLGRLAALVGLAVLLMLPLLLPIIQSAANTGSDGAMSSLLLGRSANALDFFLPSTLHPLWGQAVAQLGPRWHPFISAWNVALGYTLIALAIWACVRSWRQSWPWLCLALFGLLLALGPSLNIGDWRSGIPMPYAFLLNIPGLNLAQRPGHFVIITGLALIPLSAIGMNELIKARSQRSGWAILGVVTALVGFEYVTPPLTVQRPNVPEVYQQIAGQPGALMIIPSQEDNSFSLRNQMVHKRPIVGGYLARTPRNTFAEHLPSIRQLWRMRPELNTLVLSASDTPATVLSDYNISQVVVHWDRLNPEERQSVEQALAQSLPGIAPSNSDPNVSLYTLPESPIRPFAFFSDGWYGQEQAEARRWYWMTGAGQIRLVNPTEAALPIQLHLRAESYLEPRAVELQFEEQLLGEWTVDAQPNSSARHFDLLLPPGEHVLQLRAPAEYEEAHRGPISIVITQIEIGIDF